MFNLKSSDIEAKFADARDSFWDLTSAAESGSRIDWTGDVAFRGNGITGKGVWIFEVVATDGSGQVTMWMDQAGNTNEEVSDFFQD